VALVLLLLVWGSALHAFKIILSARNRVSCNKLVKESQRSIDFVFAVRTYLLLRAPRLNAFVMEKVSTS
jgi:hypothetical protein